MPLIIAFIAIVVLFVSLHDSKKEYNRKSADYAVSMRKTNARLEQETLDRFFRQGMSFNDAYEATLKEIVSLGYDPCIPRDAYGKKSKTCAFDKAPSSESETSWVESPEKYDSHLVKMRKKDFNGNDELVYKNFPKTHCEYEIDLKRSSLRAKTIEKGQWITYPGYGTCEVLGYNYSPLGTKGTYKVRVISTGEIVNTIKIGDSKIRHMDNTSWN